MALLIVLLKLGVGILALPIYVLNFLGLWEPISKRLFPCIMSIIARDYNEKMQQHKKDLFSNLGDFVGSSGELILLEIGCGTGTNFQHYPRGCKLICADPNPHFQKYLNKSLKENEHVQCERFLVASGEDLTQVATASVDVVICTLVLCSVKSIEAVLREVKRVLRKGGAFYFMEHVSEDASSWVFFFQQICDPTWQRLFDGCHLTRETWKDLEQAGFTELKLRHIKAPLKFNLLKAHILGYALK